MADTGTPSKCPRCGAPVTPDAPEGLCPRCLMALNLATQTEATGDDAGGKLAETPPISEIAKHFPQLEILECLGRGGMGVVYKARQPRLDRVVALKILAREKGGGARFAERFTREAQALARLSHPNIVAVYDSGESGGLYYLLMEFVDGANLRQLLRSQKITPAEALAIVPKICEALQYAHEQGIVHRDIKPENILLDKQGRVKIADFGIAKILGREGRAEPLTGAQQVVGTPHYMAPEQVEKPATVDHRADIYSLGVVFYEMLTGELPLGKFAAPSQKVHIDVRLDEVVLHALEKEPGRRYQQASHVKTAVETISTSPPVETSRPPTRATDTWKTVTVLCAAAALVLALVVGLMALTRSVSNQPQIAASNTNLPEAPPHNTRPADWLKAAGVDLDKVDLKTAPVTQAMLEEIQPDGTSRFHDVTRGVNDSGQPLEELRFINSDMVEVKRIVDTDGNSIPFTSTHSEQHFYYKAILARPVPVGAAMVYGIEGITRNLVDEDPAGGTFTYHLNHFPNAGATVRRVEIHRLPPGAELLEVSTNAIRRDVNGRTEIRLDQIVPDGEGIELSYRYRLKPESTPTK